MKEEKNLIEATQQEVETKDLATQMAGSPMSDGNNKTNNFSNNKSQKEKNMKANADHERQFNPSVIENELPKSAALAVAENETEPMFDSIQIPETDLEEDYDSAEDDAYFKPRSGVPSSKIYRGDVVKMARKQNIRQRKTNKLKRLTNELKAVKDTIKRGTLMKVIKIEKVDENGNKSTKEVKTYLPIDTATKMLWLNKKIKIESEMFELKQTLNELKSEVKMKAANHLRASRLSLSQKKKEHKRSQTIARYKGWLEMAAKNGSMKTIKEASILQSQGRSSEAIEMIMAVLLKYKLLKNPGAKATLEFDEAIGKELLNYLNKSQKIG